MGDMVGAVVVVNYGSAALLRQNFASTGFDEGPFEMIVVDNFSTSAERDAITRLALERGWHLILAENCGFGVGMNRGVSHALGSGSNAVLLLNPDVRISSQVAVQLLRDVHRYPDSLVTPAMFKPDGSRAFAEGTLDLRSGITRTRGELDPSQERWLSGACLAVSAELWARVDGFSEDYFMYWEDLELSHRCLQSGGKLRVREDLSAIHYVGGTQGGSAKSSLYRYYNCRNRLVFAERNLSPVQVRAWLRSSPNYCWRVIARDGRRYVVRHPVASVMPALKGTLAGIRFLVRRSR